jgi:hypothetical protein
MKMLSNRKKLSIAILVVSGVATVVICCVMNFVLIPKIEAGNPPIRCFDMCTTGYTVEDAHAFIDWLSPEARHIYLDVQLPLDFFYPIFYTVFFVFLWIVLHGKPNLFVAVPSALAVCDYIENSLVITMLKNPDFSPVIARVASWATMLKTALMYITILVLVFAMIFCVLRALRRRHQRQSSPDSPPTEE